MIVFLSCVKQKRSEACEAKDIYISQLFKKAFMYAKKLNPSKIFILSAKYGVLELNDKIFPYNLTLNSMNKSQQKQWAYRCYLKLKEKKINFEEEAIFLCGENYRKYLMQVFKNSKCPVENLSLGNQLKFYNGGVNVLH